MAKKKYTKAIGKKAEDYLAKGYSQRALIAHLRISHATHNAWRKLHKEYDTHIERGIARCEEFYIDKGLKLIDGGKGNAQALFFFMKNILRWRDNVEGDSEKQPINITFTKLDA